MYPSYPAYPVIVVILNLFEVFCRCYFYFFYIFLFMDCKGMSKGIKICKLKNRILKKASMKMHRYYGLFSPPSINSFIINFAILIIIIILLLPNFIFAHNSNNLKNNDENVIIKRRSTMDSDSENSNTNNNNNFNDNSNNNNNNNEHVVSSCASCHTLREKMKVYTREELKKSILQGLGLSEPFNISAFNASLGEKMTQVHPIKQHLKLFNMDHPQPQQHKIRHQNTHPFNDPGSILKNPSFAMEDDDVKSRGVYALAKPCFDSCPRHRGHVALRYSFEEKMVQSKILSAMLWVHQNQRTISRTLENNTQVVLTVYKLISPGNNQQYVEVLSAEKTLNASKEWLGLDFSEQLSNHFKTSDCYREKCVTTLDLVVHAQFTAKNMSHAKVPLNVDFSQKNNDEYPLDLQAPYIEISTVEGRKSRTKRTIAQTCSEDSNEKKCCRYPLTIDFESYKWDFIIAPKKYEAYFCAGECPYVYLQNYPHTHVVLMANKSTSTPTNFGPCCAPKKYSPISMLYFDITGNIIFGVLPNMVVDRCGCS